MSTTLDLDTLFDGTAKLADLPTYLSSATAQVPAGNAVILTGRAPVWLYLAVAHALHGRVKKLSFYSPRDGEILIFDHDAY